MRKVHLMPWAWAVGGAGLLMVMHVLVGLSIAGWIAGAVYLLVSTTLVVVGLVRRGMPRFGPANAVTATRSALVGVITALAITALTQPVPPLAVVALTVPALLLDAVDGWTARRTGTASPLGARFDMEVDAFLLLVLGVFDAPSLGVWVLAIGLMRYVYVAAGWVMPWLTATVPPRYWRKVVTAVCGIALTLGASQLVPPAVSMIAIGIALLMLVESFGRDVIWLWRRRASAARPPRPRPVERPRSG